MTVKLLDIHTKYDTDKGTAHSYIETYDDLFAPLQHDAINFLEIGALTCGSLKMFHEYFSQAHIYGLDNWIQQADHVGTSFEQKGVDMAQIIQDVTRNYPRVHLVTCDSTNSVQVNTKLSHLTFQIIVDDGDHHPHAQFNTFQNFWSLWDRTQGVYVIEDVIDINYLTAIVQSHVTQNNLNVRLTPKPFYKNNRGDDSVLVIQPV